MQVWESVFHHLHHVHISTFLNTGTFSIWLFYSLLASVRLTKNSFCNNTFLGLFRQLWMFKFLNQINLSTPFYFNSDDFCPAIGNHTSFIYENKSCHIETKRQISTHVAIKHCKRRLITPCYFNSKCLNYDSFIVHLSWYVSM